MALLLEDHDLSSADTFSTEIDTPGNVNLEWKVTGDTSEGQVVDLEWWGYVEDPVYHQLPDPRVLGKKLVSRTYGNESSNDNIFGVNVAKMKIKVISKPDQVGTISIWGVTS